METLSKNNTQFVQKLNELLQLQKEQEKQTRLAEEFSLKLKKELSKADIKEFQFKSVDEFMTTDRNSFNSKVNELNNEEHETINEINESNKNSILNQKEFNERLLSDIVEESFEQGLLNDAVHSKFSTPKEDNYNQNQELINDQQQQINQSEEETIYNSLNKKYTKLCTEECTKKDCTHTIRYSETYERILKIISNYNSKNLNNNNNDLINENDHLDDEDENSLEEFDDEDDEDTDEDENNDDDEDDDEIFDKKNEIDYKTELKTRFSNQNIYQINEFFKEELTKSLDPNLNNDQYVYKSLSETNLNYNLSELSNDESIKNNNLKSNDFKLKNRTFSNDAINNQLKSIEKDLDNFKDVENCPIKPGIDGRNVRTFDELLNQHINDYSLSSMFIRPENPTKRPYLRKGAGLKRFQNQRSTSEPRGKLCRVRNQKIKQKINQDKKVQKKSNQNKKLPDPKRIDYLAQPKNIINKEFGDLIDKENDLRINQSKIDSINRDYMTSNLSDKYNNDSFEIKKPNASSINKKLSNKEIDKKENIKDVTSSKDKSRKQTTETNEQVTKKPKVQLISKISVNKTIEDRKKFNNNKDTMVHKEWDKKESIEDSNRRIEVLLEKFIELYEIKNNTKADDEMRKNLINMLKNSLRLDSGLNEPIKCKECGKNLEEESDSESSFCCVNPIEADQTSSKFSNDPDTYLITPKLGMQTIALRNKIENLQRRLAVLQTRCGQDEKKIDKKDQKLNCQSFSNDNKECTCSGQMEQLKEKLNFITNKLKLIEKNVNNTNVNGFTKSDEAKIINHQIILQDSEDDELLRPSINKRVQKQSQFTKPKILQTDSINQTKFKSKIDAERKITNQKNQKELNRQQSDSPTDVVVEKKIDGDSRITKYRSGLKIVEKSDGTVQKFCTNGYQELFFPDDTIMRILTDGTKIIDFTNGEREIRTSNYKRREYIDGSIRTTYIDGTRETRYVDGRLLVKDKYGNIIANSRILQNNFN